MSQVPYRLRSPACVLKLANDESPFCSNLIWFAQLFYSNNEGTVKTLNIGTPRLTTVVVLINKYKIHVV